MTKRLKRFWRHYRMQQWYFSGPGMAYYRALDDVWDNVPEARAWIAQRRAELDPRKFVEREFSDG